MQLISAGGPHGKGFGVALFQRCWPLFSQLSVVLQEIATFFIFTNYFATFPKRCAEKRAGSRPSTVQAMVIVLNINLKNEV